jgi:hypothetical protein
MSPTAGPDLYPKVTAPLTARGLETYVEYGLSDWIIRVPLSGGRRLVISPPQEPPAQHPPGLPPAWLVTLDRDIPPEHEVVYDSQPGGPHYAHQGGVNALLAAVDRRLDRLGIPPRPAPRTRKEKPDREPKPTPAQVRALAAIRDGDVRLRLPSIRSSFTITAPGISTTTVEVCRSRRWISVDNRASSYVGRPLSLTPAGADVLAAAEQAVAARATSPARTQPVPSPPTPADNPAPRTPPAPPAGRPFHR